MRNPAKVHRIRLARLRSALLTAAAITSSIAIAAQQPAPPPSTSSTQPKKTAPNTPRQQSDGERVFAENCSRCHNPPDGFSSRISGTVVHHMHMRASLSRQDEQALLRFFNPK